MLMARNVRLTIAFCLLVTGSTSGPVVAQDTITDSSSILTGKYELYATKSATKAFLIGLGPGLLVHCLGHYYVGDKRTGNAILISELISLPVILGYVYIGALHGLSEGGSYHDDDKIETYEATLVAGLIIFVGGWVVDYFGAPNKVINARKMLKLNPNLSMFRTQKSVNVELSITF